MPRKVVALGAASSSTGACCFCGLKEDNELEYGKIHEYNGIVTHYYCLLLSSNMQQKGRDDEGILGFLPEDINKELRRGKRLACCYCKKTGATLGCCNTRCKRIFHFPCGLKSGSLHQFFGEFRSYCKKHRPRQKIDDLVSEEVKKREDMICYICYDDVNPNDKYRTLWAPCCKKNAWFHRSCVQQLAMSAGYFFKCPLCNNKPDFQKSMLDHGIFIPSQDASWELVPNAFEELLYRHNRCDADKCLCPKGREHTSANANWELTLCRTCGSQGIHMACGHLKWVKPIWECGECTSILNKTLASDSDTNSIVSGREITRDDDNDDSTDSDISVGTETTDQSSSPSKNQDDEFKKIHDIESHGEHVRITRRSIIPIPRSPVNTRIQSPKASTTTMETEDLPPEPKRPRYSDFVGQRNRRQSIDSDDDIMFISGPSTNQSPVSEKQKNTEETISSLSSISKNFDNKDSSLKEESDEIKNTIKSSNILYDTLNKKQQLPIKSPIQVTSEADKRVIEIDLSESECSIPEVKSSKTIVKDIPIVNSMTNSPELKFMITNVTSLAPEAFESVQQEQKLDVNNDTTKSLPTLNNFSQSAGGLTSQTPIVLDDEPLPQNNSISMGNNLRFLSNGLHDQITIVRFNGISNATGENTVFYGLTIPGTNQTIPLIFTPVDNPNATSTSGINNNKTTNEITNTVNDNTLNKQVNNILIPPLAPLSSGINETGKIENFQHSAATAIARNLDIPIRPMPTLSMSVPLKSIVNERFPTPPFVSKNLIDKNSNTTVGTSNQDPFDNIPPLISTQSSNTISNTLQIRVVETKIPVEQQKIPVAQQKTPVAQKNMIRTHIVGPLSKKLRSDVQANNNSLTNDFGPPPLIKKPILSGQLNNNNLTIGLSTLPTLKPSGSNPEAIQNLSNNIDTNMIAKMLTIMPKESSRGSQVHSSNSNPEREPRFSSYGRSRGHQQNKNKTNVTNVTAVDIRPTTHLSQSTQLQIQKSAENKQTNDDTHVYQVFGTDSNGSSDDCDGDAGSGPAVQPASAINPTNAKPSNTRHDPEISCQRVQSLQNGERSIHERTSGGRSDTDSDDEVDCSASSDWSDSSNRAGLIYNRISLRNINFSVRESNILKMTLYDTYSVNIEVDSYKRKKYSSWKKISTSSLDPEVKKPDIERCVIEKIANKLDLVANDNLSNDGISNEYENTSQILSVESVDQTNDLSNTDVETRGQDEVKENLDPIPLSTNSSNNGVYIVERKSKLRPRSGDNNSIRFLNDKDEQRTIIEKSEIPIKVTSQESQIVENRSKMYYNGFKDNECYDESIDQNTLSDRRFEIDTKNLTNRNSFNENNDNSIIIDSADIDTSKRKHFFDENFGDIEKLRKLTNKKTHEKRYYTNRNHLVNDAVNSKRKWNSSDDISRPKKFHVNSIIKGRKNNENGEPLSCKVSIDLKKIQAILAIKLKSGEQKSESDLHQKNTTHTINRNKLKDVHHSKSLITLSKSQSFDNLTFHSRDNTITGLWKSKSFENIRNFGSYVKHSIDIKSHECKINIRNFEKNDCVR